MSAEKLDPFRVRRELKGKTLHLYHQISKRRSGYTIDEIRLLKGFSNRALINQCLAEMKKHGIIEKRGDRYCVPASVAEALDFAFKHYAKIGGKLLPRGFVAAIGYAMFLAVYLLFVPAAFSLIWMGLIVVAAFAGLGAYESYRARGLLKRLRSTD
ncbi:MAG: hypothetical protein QFX33_02340 [Candidatus Nezhaarchaeota archaeon]|nr:hypothetical protein [Candidatus Nezhaarchaeota archaeon]